MTRYLIVPAALLAAACGSAQSPLAPSSVALSTATAGDTRVSTREANSCPSDAPTGLTADTFGRRADLTFTAPAGVYEARITRRDTGEVWTTQNGNDGAPRIEWQLPVEDGTFDAVVYRKVCGTTGRETGAVTFSLGDAPVAAPLPPVVEPLPPVVVPPVIPPVVVPPVVVPPVVTPTDPPPPVLEPFRVCTDVIFTGSNGAKVVLTLPRAVTAFTVTTYDAGHHAGYQTDQTEERLWVGTATLLALTDDIPEAATSRATSFVSPTATTQVGLTHEGIGVNSVHGACVEGR